MNTIRDRHDVVARQMSNAINHVVASVRLARDHVLFLDHFRAQVARDTGYRISRSALLQVLADVVTAARLDLRDVASETELTQRLCGPAGRRLDRRAPMNASHSSARHRIAPATHCTVTLRMSNATLVTLDFLAIDIRCRSGLSISRSAILRSLVRWMESCDIDTRLVLSRDGLRTSLLMTLPCGREE